MSKKLAPVAIFVYNRLDNTRAVIEALAQNTLAKETDVFVFSDGPKTDKQKPAVDAIRAYLKTIDGFKSLTVIERPTNFYIERNIIDGVTEIINHFGRVIVLEDDGVTARSFLAFMNRALDFYEEHERVMHIATFTFIKFPVASNRTFFTTYSENTGGGWATWKNRWEKFYWFKNEAEGLAALTEEQKKIVELDGALSCLDNLKANPIPWDICWNIAIVKNNGLAANSPWPLIKNNGLFNGTHFTILNRLSGKSPFDIELVEKEEIVFDDNITENKESRQLLKDFYGQIGQTTRGKVVGSILKILVALKITKLLKKIIS